MTRTNLSCRRLVVASALVAAAAVPALGVTLSVPQQYPTIQAAINAAVVGDVVVVAPGVYSGAGNRDLNLMGKAITLRGSGGPGSCVIDASEGSQVHCGFMFQNNEPSTTVIEGFTITGGYQFNGGGIYVHNGSPTIRNCVITGNDVGCWGGGVYCEGGSSPRFYNCSIVGNSSADEGGGVFITTANAYFESCVISSNTAATGGGVCAFGGQTMFVNCRITGNTVTNSGGGLFLWSGKLVNCTVANNFSPFQGSGVYMGSTASVTNSIVWGNTGSPTMLNQSGVVTYSIVEGGTVGAGNSTANPGFVNAASGNYRLVQGSPAIDAGSNQAIPPGVTTDLAGLARIASQVSGKRATRVDIGAYEYQITARP